MQEARELCEGSTSRWVDSEWSGARAHVSDVCEADALGNDRLRSARARGLAVWARRLSAGAVSRGAAQVRSRRASSQARARVAALAQCGPGGLYTQSNLS